MKNSQYLLLLLVGIFSLASCDDDDTPPDPGAGDEELITSVMITLSNNASPSTPNKVFLWQDADGPGGDNPIMRGDTLEAGSTYSYLVSLGDAVSGPINDEVSKEVREENDEHQLFFEFANVAVTSAYNGIDEDDNGNPLGLDGTWTTGIASMGNFTVSLRHEPNKNAAGVKDGDITNAGGESDVELTFPLVIQ